MSYMSQVALKTTTEGYLLMREFGNTIEEYENKPLAWLNISKTKDGFYKIWHDSIKWYESFANVINFNKVLTMLKDQDIPFSFIRIGEETDDIVHDINWVTDMPDCISTFEPQIEVYDPDEFVYEDLPKDDLEKGSDTKCD